MNNQCSRLRLFWLFSIAMSMLVCLPLPVRAIDEFGFKCALSALHPDEDPIVLFPVHTNAGGKVEATKEYLRLIENGVSLDEIKRKSALKECRLAVESDPVPQNIYRLSRALLSGEPLAEDVEEARLLAIRALRAGYKIAHLSMAHIASVHDQDANLALEHIHGAAGAGVPSGIFWLGEILLFNEEYPGKRQEGLRLLNSIREKKPASLILLARYYFAKSKEFQDWKMAETFLLEASELGEADAHIQLANLYFEKGGSFRDRKKSILYAQRAAETIHAGTAYEILFREWYFASDDEKNLVVARGMASKGAADGNLYLKYASASLLLI